MDDNVVVHVLIEGAYLTGIACGKEQLKQRP
jgi:hypothetical protein